MHAPFQRPKDAPLNILNEAFLRTKRAFAYVLLFSFVINLLLLSLPIYSMQVLDRVISSHSMATLWLLTAIAIFLCAAFGLFSTIRGIVLNRVGEWLEIKVGPKLLQLSVSRAAMGIPSGGGQQLRELTSIKNFINSGVSNLFDAPWSIMFILVIYAINPVLGFITLMGAVLLLFSAIVTEFISKKPLERANQILLKSFGMADSAGRNAEAVEAMGMMPNVIHSWQQYHRQTLDIQAQVGGRAGVVLAVSKIIRMGLQVLITGVGCYLVLDHQMTVGGMIAASTISGRALAPFEAAIGMWKTLVGARDSYHRLNAMLDGTPEYRGTMELPAPQGFLSIENLFYRPFNSDRQILRGLNFQLPAGESLGVIGPSAAGKSTLAKLLIGVLPPSHGTVRLDGAEIAKWNRELLGPHVGYMPQDVEIFNGTMRENIARMDPNAPAEKVVEAAMMAGVHEMILRLPKGYDTEFSDSNRTLSPGQLQRIGLARAMYGNPKLVVLDEPNSNLDADGERALVQAMNILKARKVTTIVVAHRPSIVANVDKILMLRDGIVEQFGPREQVLQRYSAPNPAQQAALQQQARAAAGATPPAPPSQSGGEAA